MKKLYFVLIGTFIVLAVILSLVYSLRESGTSTSTSLSSRNISNVQNSSTETGSGAFDGYTLLMPIASHIVPLIDMNGSEVHEWNLGSTTLGLAAYLLSDGRLLATYTLKSNYFTGKGINGGGIEILSWNGTKLWNYELNNATYHLNHDVAYMNNGDILAISYDRIVGSAAVKLGFNSSYVNKNGDVWLESIFEINTSNNKVVWSWYAKNHLLPPGENASGHPDLLNPAYVTNENSPDWLHFNSIDYNSALDQIIVSSRNLNEFYIIDHKTGDIIYRYGNPAAYGSSGKQTLYGQHDVHWINSSSANSNIMLFNNGYKTRNYSTVMELKPGNSFGKADIVWDYGNNSGDYHFFSDHLGSVQRLENGDTLICSGTQAKVFEINQQGEVVWNYTNTEYGKKTSRGIVGDLFRATRYSKDYLGNLI